MAAKIFVSYAHADNLRLNEKTPGWVSNFVDQLQKHIGTKPGGSGVECWMDYRLEPQRSVDETLRQRIRESKCILAFMSPRYLESEWCRKEMATFVELVGKGGSNDRVFLVELLPTDRKQWHSGIQSISEMKFWSKSLEEPEPIMLGWPRPDTKADEEYWVKLNILADVLARQIQGLPPTDPATPPEVVPATPSPDIKEPDFLFSEGAAKVIEQARLLAKNSGRAGVTSSCLLFAFTEIAGSRSDTASFVSNASRRFGRYSDAFAEFLKDSGNPSRQSVKEGGKLLGKISGNIWNVLEFATKITVRVSGKSREINQRHLFAALLTATPEPNRLPVAWSRLQDMGIEIPTLCREFRDFIRVNAGQDNAAEWDAILTPGDTKRSLYTAGTAGYTPEFCGVGGTEPVLDHLGVEGQARRLAELIASHDTQLPLAVGLFGNWGSGKTHFMNLMDRHMKKLAGDEKNKPGTWCRDIVPIYFNAWHYLDTNLWASLVTEIFDGLFRHIAGDPDSSEERKKKIQYLIDALQSANGATASAEECIVLAKEEKLRAEAAMKKAEEEATHAARWRVRLEGGIAGIMDNLQKLIPEGEMQKNWGEAMRVLHLKEACSSWTTLTAQLAEFKSLQGRLRAVGRAILAPEGRVRRLSWLAGAVLGAPLVVGFVVWGLTFWNNSEIRQIGMFMGEVTGLLTGIVGWCGVQLQRGRKLIECVEELEKAAREKRTQQEKSPKIKRARAAVAEYMMAEEQARTQVNEARARVRQLEDELREIQPEKRLFRFIEQRAKSQDYRSHLGLVSLVRRDFHKLSCLFTEKANNKKETQWALNVSIDRIVLFVDDLDRCQPKTVVDVLQAVHLLLAYPLFAVVVGVDQRCLKLSIEKEFTGLVSQGASLQEETRPATSLDYLEKIFHVPFHLPPMEKGGFGILIEELAKKQTEKQTEKQAEKQIEKQAENQAEKQTENQAGKQTEAQTEAQTEKQTSVSLGTTSQVIGSVPLEAWERTALKDYHQFIRTPRGAIRLLNTYRLVRAGILEAEWDAFRGDETLKGEFRITMLLLAAASGYPALAREWFKTLRNLDETAPFLPDMPEQTRWSQFKVAFPALITKPSKEVLVKWLDRVEQFAF